MKQRPAKPCSFLSDEVRKRNEPKSLANVLGAWLEKNRPVDRRGSRTRTDGKSAGGASVGSGGLSDLAEIWSETVGRSIASRSEVQGLRGGILRVGVDATAIAQELEFARSNLVQSLVDRGIRLHDIKFQLRPRRRSRARGGGASR